ncbi:complement C1q tumor necrosis factor-related protein 3 [Etheostoma spectabile]|uniref:complement C1q tumor necrosis factor-related protein 3 n=1 Tax=Etheostoma spectabile TaxID=54343 RepID=UPI0013AF35AB|nr:complement C1q tumor necrosis factor-related protein 3-like [Etheostoma spectabile]
MVRDISAELARMQAFMNTAKAQLDTDVDNLKKQVKASQVAFSACLVAGGNTKDIGPTSTTLVFSHVPLNVGNVYNSITGLFTAPVKGVYHFDWTVGAFGDGSRGSGAWLVKNREKVALAFEVQMDGFMSGSKGVSLSLLKGDVVSLRLLGNGLVFDDYNCLTTFSGHLLFLL